MKYVPLLLWLPVLLPALEAGRVVLWAQDFESVEVGLEPDDTLVLNGQFTVEQEQGGNKALALPGAPLETMNILLEPSRGTGTAIRASIKGEKTGRREPAFGVGLGGASGYRFMLFPQRGVVELLLDEQPLAKSEYKWAGGSWTLMKLEVSEAEGGAWLVRGKVWNKETPEPADWNIQWKATEEPPVGQASLWGLPYSGKTLWYDDVEYSEKKK